VDKDVALATAAARVFAQHISGGSAAPAKQLPLLARKTLQPPRALVQAARSAAPREEGDRHIPLPHANLEALIQLCGSSDSFAEMIAANPALITSLGSSRAISLRRDYRAILRAAIDAERSFPAEMAALRLQWAELIAEIGSHDVANELSI